MKDRSETRDNRQYQFEILNIITGTINYMRRKITKTLKATYQLRHQQVRPWNQNYNQQIRYHLLK